MEPNVLKQQIIHFFAVTSLSLVSMKALGAEEPSEPSDRVPAHFTFQNFKLFQTQISRILRRYLTSEYK